jgi:putative membrane protein
MRNPVKTAKRQLLRVGSCTLSALMVLGSIPAAAIGDGVTATYDEAYYAMTDYYGNLTDGSVVKSYRTNGIATLTDYGDYDEIINLTDGTAPARNGGMTTFRLDEKALPGTFYFEGKTTKPFQQLPWTISMSYTLNGVPTKAEDLAGQAGVVEIRLDIVPNGRASEYARNNYTLEAMAIFNQDDILSLEAPGAQVQLIGNLRAVLFLGLPGEECHYTIRVGSDDFSFGGMTFLMVPATLSQLEEIAKLSERKDDLEDNYNKLSGSIDSLLDAMTAMTGSLNASANGLEQLNKARGIFSDGKGVIYSGTDALREDLSNLADVLEPVEGQIEALSKTISDSKSTLRSMTNTVFDLKGDLKDVESALRDLEDGTGDVKALLRASGNLQKSLEDLRQALGDTSAAIPTDPIVKPGTGKDLKTQMNQVVQLHSIYEKAENGNAAAFFTAMLTLKDKTDAEIAAAVPLLQGTLKNVENGTVTIEQVAAANPEGAALIGLYLQINKKEMSFQKFCESVLPAKFPNKSPAEIKKMAKLMNDLWLVYASGDTTGHTLSDDFYEVYADILDLDDEAVYEISASFLQNDEEGSSTTGTTDTTDTTDTTGSTDTTDTTDVTAGSTDTTDTTGSTDTTDTTDEVGDPIENNKPNDAIIDLITDGIDSAASQISELQRKLNSAMNKVLPPTQSVLKDLAALCGRIENLSSLLNSAEDLSAAIRHSSADLRDILDDVEDLQDILDEYEPTLQETLATVSSLSTSAIKTIRDTQGLISDTEALMKSTGATLDDGTKQTLEGLAAVLRSTAKTMGTAGQIKDAKTSICDIIEDTWDEYTGDVNNLLLMDATAEAVSLTDSRNPSPESIQILIRTQEITMPDEDETEAEAAAEVQTTFWGRVAQMFKDFWAAITGLFGGKD